jgi:hypothetical protein
MWSLSYYNKGVQGATDTQRDATCRGLQVLKEKFDDIFAATKYTKALESLRKLRLDKSHEVSQHELAMLTVICVRTMQAPPLWYSCLHK